MDDTWKDQEGSGWTRGQSERKRECRAPKELHQRNESTYKRTHRLTRNAACGHDLAPKILKYKEMEIVKGYDIRTLAAALGRIYTAETREELQSRNDRESQSVANPYTAQDRDSSVLCRDQFLVRLSNELSTVGEVRRSRHRRRSAVQVGRYSATKLTIRIEHVVVSTMSALKASYDLCCTVALFGMLNEKCLT